MCEMDWDFNSERNFKFLVFLHHAMNSVALRVLFLTTLLISFKREGYTS